MTLLPFKEQQKLKGALGPAYEVAAVCSRPGCMETATERHHLVRRSFLAGAYDWIEYDGVMIQNVVGLCHADHLRITDNVDWIEWSSLGHFNWVERLVGRAEKLDPHPQVGLEPSRSGLQHELVQPDVCPTCHRPRPRKTAPAEAKRQRKQWSIHIPMDERENGAEVLDLLLEAARESMARAGLPYGDEDNARYFILTAVLGLFVQHSTEVMSDS